MEEASHISKSRTRPLHVLCLDHCVNVGRWVTVRETGCIMAYF